MRKFLAATSIIIAIVSILYLTYTKVSNSNDSTIENISTGTGGDEGDELELQQKFIEFISGSNIERDDIPIKNTITVLPDEVRSKLIEKLLVPQNYSKYSVVDYSNKEWVTYEFEQDNFIEIYDNNFLTKYYKGSTRLFLINEKEKRFIRISKDVVVKNESSFLKSIIKIFENSKYYRDYPLLDIVYLQKTPFGYETQLNFYTLYSKYDRQTIDGRAFENLENWDIDYATSDTYQSFIETKNTENSIEADTLKNIILNSLKNLK